MKQTLFSNKVVYWIIIVIVSVLMIINLYATLTTGRLIGLLPITVQGVLLSLILTKNQYAKIGIKIWATVFMVIASGLQFVGQLLQDLADSFANDNLLHYTRTGLTILIGVLIVVSVNKTVKVIEIEK